MANEQGALRVSATPLRCSPGGAAAQTVASLRQLITSYGPAGIVPGRLLLELAAAERDALPSGALGCGVCGSDAASEFCSNDCATLAARAANGERLSRVVPVTTPQRPAQGQRDPALTRRRVAVTAKHVDAFVDAFDVVPS